MVFSSTIFLFFFLPIVLAGYYVARGIDQRNTLLLVASLLFYAWGEVFYLLVLVLSIIWNRYIGQHIARKRSAHRWLAAGIVGNIALLGFYKYANFMVENINSIFAVFNLSVIDWSPVHLPLGISFFTFQAITYLVDIYRGHAEVQKRFREVALYISLFPQLVAGPIVRYQTIANQLSNRKTSLDGFAYGVRRFSIGLAKKVLLANYLGEMADAVFGTPTEFLTTADVWIGLVCYTLQIYFDFSGYSDMAIGLGYMFGFKFPENFNYPYISTSIQEFWRRWHITLSTWFRDYLYIPLGGSHRGAFSTYRNLFVVFALCGLWHGASWTFLIWGMYHGMFLVLERIGLGRALKQLPRILQHLYLVLVIMTGWVFFRADSLPHALNYLHIMLGFAGEQSYRSHLSVYYDTTLWALLTIAVIASTPLATYLRDKMAPTTADFRYSSYASDSFIAAMFACALIAAAAGTYNPFIYFRF